MDSRGPVRSSDMARKPLVDFTALNIQIKSARSSDELSEFCRKRGALFSGMQHCMVCTACTRFRWDDNGAALLCILAANEWLCCPRDTSGRDARGASTVYYSLAKVKAHRIILPADVAVRINLSMLIANVGFEAASLTGDFNEQNASNCLWAAATLGVRDEAIVGPLVVAACRVAQTFNAQGAANCLWAVATLGICDEAIIGTLATACVSLSRTFNAQGAANCLWAAATLGVRKDIVRPLALACVEQSRSFSVQDAANSLWAAAKLDVQDMAIIGPLVAACVFHSHTFNAQGAANSLWAVATLGFHDEVVIHKLASACVAKSPTFNAQNAANSLWAAATLGIRDKATLRH